MELSKILRWERQVESVETRLEEKLNTSLSDELTLPRIQTFFESEDVTDTEVDKSRSILSSSSSIYGDIQIDSALTFSGILNGNIISSDTVDTHLGAQIYGDVYSDEFYLVDGHIEGNINVNARVEINKNSSVIGNIYADYVVISGKVNGNIVAHKSLEITNSAFIVGDAQTEVLSIADGAHLNGVYKIVRNYEDLL